MLDLLEKITFGLGGLCVVVTLAFYAWIRLPSTDSVEFLPKPIREAETAKPAGSTSGEAGNAAPSEEEQAIAQKLQEQGVKLLPGQKLQMETYQVQRDHFEYVRGEANWTRELKKAHSDRIRTKGGETRLKVYNVAADSLLRTLGIQDNDVIELIDGEIITFNETSNHALYTRAKSLINKLQEGGTISVTVTRNNRPVHLKFHL